MRKAIRRPLSNLLRVRELASAGKTNLVCEVLPPLSNGISLVLMMMSGLPIDCVGAASSVF
jgi:hypothetical protein